CDGDRGAVLGHGHEPPIEQLSAVSEAIPPRGVRLRGTDRAEDLLRILPAGGDDLHVAAKLFEGARGGGAQLRHFGIHARIAEIAGPADADSVEPPVARGGGRSTTTR